MAKRSAKPLKPRDIQGLKYVERLLPLLDQLHDVGCQRDRSGNRSLHYDQYCMLVLLFLFNPVLRSLRSLQQASTLNNVQRKLGCARASLGSLSEAVEVFEPERLRGIIESLAAEVKPVRDVRGGHLAHALTAVDGSVVKTLKTIAEAAFMNDKNGGSHSGWRLHTHFAIDRHVPTRIEVSAAANSGHNDEKNRLRAALQSDHCYVLDRWYAQFTLWNDIVAAGSSYVCRIRDNSNLNAVIEERPVSATAAAADVLRDFIVDLGAAKKPDERPAHRVRVILVKTTPHTKRGGRKGGTAGPPSDGVLRIATNLLDVPAEVIADIYRHRWTIELFFRFFKHVLGCRHLLSTHPKGIEIQAYCAIIACLLISLWTGRKPTLRSYEMICLYFAGWASLEELLDHISKLKSEET
ncbi:Transposase DDE domain-containing protein [Singulisphaera sp. GP187]|uniref:IS4 family transposase n=1 Tax=Singulisphaera sp. GP187 TaxID=1882752 RepID=UPI00092C2F9A|nr:IS4 family transposase [Singulisphaera sp. GP187]SIN68418.1 Transposase DDE domain-containing protein [Singulisphaera sp. GP187]SIN74277.1 Transposase DDE domain-containing protein [Singulisphaera sp. GP187]SIO33985.1 Transposase DDE domain-containing protein [Singulisphaera sp. GP187]SIO44964.1 Transposase DDE domain-containing protein [Singulisphaera sp. GP187]SIO56021.1 Transposase DDE domain-containing protein [Singulisphaera sp. GP187]